MNPGGGGSPLFETGWVPPVAIVTLGEDLPRRTNPDGTIAPVLEIELEVVPPGRLGDELELERRRRIKPGKPGMGLEDVEVEIPGFWARADPAATAHAKPAVTQLRTFTRFIGASPRGHVSINGTTRLYQGRGDDGRRLSNL